MSNLIVLCSGKDQMLPSAEEAKRLRKAIPGCRVRYFKNSGHTLLLVSPPPYPHMLHEMTVPHECYHTGLDLFYLLLG